MKAFKSDSTNRTDMQTDTHTHTDPTEHITTTAVFVGDNKI